MADNLNDFIKAVVQPDPDGNMQDGMRDYFGVSAGITLNGAILKALQGRGATSDNLGVAWSQYLAIDFPALEGTLQDRQKAFWQAGGFPP